MCRVLIPDILPVEFALWIQYAQGNRLVHYLFSLRRRYTRLVHLVPNEALRLGSVSTMGRLWLRFLHDWSSIALRSLYPTPSHHSTSLGLVVRIRLFCWFPILRS
jgi:hypothetical protein